MGKKGYKERHLNMKVFVTGVAGQLGHDVVNELTKRGHEAIGSDIAPALETTVKYVPLDITDATAVEQLSLIHISEPRDCS